VDHLLKRIFLSFNDVDWSRTRAYSYGRMLGSIYLNVKGREPQGVVEPGREYEATREEIVRALEGFHDPVSGQRITGRVGLREELYHGPHAAEAPDLVIWPANPTDIFFGLTDFGSTRLMDTVYRYSGMHRDEGLLIAAGPGLRSGADLSGASIMDLAPTILHLLGCPVPRGMDGRVLEGLLGEGFLDRRPVAWAAEEGAEDPDAPGYTPREESEIMDRLTDLGYLG
jgi:predicted AlkP superfamily phosphohydrolase/phosphomutase